ncbi:hypothetical protein [Paenibacillus taiwanensis]|uniref:hypothetical protein n=1 Tax=Paenibacillus taiwanensis TaxID=401638 RepID=UPI00041D0693|nr:hypothetical protein [Paenibacillus taiwanensis]
MNQGLSIIDSYKEELHRIAWRLQYRARRNCNRELPLTYYSPQPNHSTEWVESVLLHQLICSIPSATGKKIIYELYLQDKTEVQVAQNLNISQQAVNKWKKKSLQFLYQTMTSQD